MGIILWISATVLMALYIIFDIYDSSKEVKNKNNTLDQKMFFDNFESKDSVYDRDKIISDFIYMLYDLNYNKKMFNELVKEIKTRLFETKE